MHDSQVIYKHKIRNFSMAALTLPRQLEHISTSFFRKKFGTQSFLNKKFHLTLYVPCIILQCVDDQRDAQFL